MRDHEWPGGRVSWHPGVQDALRFKELTCCQGVDVVCPSGRSLAGARIRAGARCIGVGAPTASALPAATIRVAVRGALIKLHGSTCGQSFARCSAESHPSAASGLHDGDSHRPGHGAPRSFQRPDEQAKGVRSPQFWGRGHIPPTLPHIDWGGIANRFTGGSGLISRRFRFRLGDPFSGCEHPLFGAFRIHLTPYGSYLDRY